MSEKALILRVVNKWCHFQDENTRQPQVPLQAKGPWIITTHGSVIHDTGGYGMLGLGHNPDVIAEAMCHPLTTPMANIMTPSLSHEIFVTDLTAEIGRRRKGGCPYVKFLMMNSGSEVNSVADRIIDMHNGHVLTTQRPIVGIVLEQCFHGRTYKPAIWTNSTRSAYKNRKALGVSRAQEAQQRTVPANDVKELIKAFATAKEKGEFVECVFMEAVMGEGNPGEQITPAFYKTARELTLQNDAMLLVDSIQAGFRCTGNLSIVDYDGFEALPPPDFEVFSKALNCGQFPMSVLAMSERAHSFYATGVYGNTMTGNPRACMVASAVLREMTEDLKSNIVAMGAQAKVRQQELREKQPGIVENVTGCGLLQALHLDPSKYTVVAVDGAETLLRMNGINVIHGGHNALRFTPNFNVTRDEIDMQVRMVESILRVSGKSSLTSLGEALQSKEQTSHSATVMLEGHLFDTGIINKVFDGIESVSDVKQKVTSIRVGENKNEQTLVALEINGNTKLGLQEAITKLKYICDNQKQNVRLIITNSLKDGTSNISHL